MEGIGKKRKSDHAKSQGRNSRSSKTKGGIEVRGGTQLPTRSVLFVENSMEGELAKRLRGVVERIQHIIKFRVKIVERAGTPLRLMFPLSNIGGDETCGRSACIT